MKEEPLCSDRNRRDKGLGLQCYIMNFVVTLKNLYATRKSWNIATDPLWREIVFASSDKLHRRAKQHN